MRTVVLVLLCAVGTSGCAVAAAKGPGPGPVRIDRKPDCNDGKGAVVLDGIGATVLGVSALAAFSADEGGVGAALGLATVGLIASAVAGSRSADRCRLAEEQWGNLVLTARTDARRLAPSPIVLDEDGDPIAPSPRPVAVTPKVVAPVTPATRPVAPATLPTPSRPVTPPATPTATAAPADDDDGAADDGAADDATTSDDPGDWSAFWREVAR